MKDRAHRRGADLVRRGVWIVSLSCACGPKAASPSSTTPPEPAHVRATDAPTTEPPATTPPADPEAASPVSFVIESSFEVSGRGPVVMGRLSGHVEVNDKLMIAGSEPPIFVEVLAVELQRDRNGETAPGMPAGLLLRVLAESDRAALVRDATLVRSY